MLVSNSTPATLIVDEFVHRDIFGFVQVLAIVASTLVGTRLLYLVTGTVTNARAYYQMPLLDFDFSCYVSPLC